MQKKVKMLVGKVAKLNKVTYNMCDCYMNKKTITKHKCV